MSQLFGCQILWLGILNFDDAIIIAMSLEVNLNIYSQVKINKLICFGVNHFVRLVEDLIILLLAIHK